jgi:hypothetical protein
MLTFVDGTGRKQSVQDVVHLYRLVIGGVIQDSTWLGCAEEVRWLPASSLDVYRQVKEFIEQGGDKPTLASSLAGSGTAPSIAAFRCTADAHLAELRRMMEEIVQAKFHARWGWVLKRRRRMPRTS